MGQNTVLVLASGSPRRRELMALGGWDFTTAPAEIDESILPGESPRDYVLRLALEKAQTAANRAEPDQIVIGADTTVVDVGEETGQETILGKPEDPADAERMLRRLRGRTHQVYTGLAVIRVSDGQTYTDLVSTDVTMRPYTDEEIAAYIATGDPMDKAGAYAIQHEAFHPVESFNGCYANVVGLPLCHLARLLGKFGLAPREDLTRSCQSALNYQCDIYQKIERGEA